MDAKYDKSQWTLCRIRLPETRKRNCTYVLQNITMNLFFECCYLSVCQCHPLYSFHCHNDKSMFETSIDASVISIVIILNNYRKRWQEYFNFLSNFPVLKYYVIIRIRNYSPIKSIGMFMVCGEELSCKGSLDQPFTHICLLENTNKISSKGKRTLYFVWCFYDLIFPCQTELFLDLILYTYVVLEK